MEETKPKIGDLVWARLDGFPWWPARIIEPSDSLMKSKKKGSTDVSVYFYGSHDVGWVEIHKIQLYECNQKESLKKKGKDKPGLQTAIMEVEFIISETKKCSCRSSLSGRTSSSTSNAATRSDTSTLSISKSDGPFTFACLLGDGDFADFTFIVKDQHFNVHKCVLAKVSKVFKEMFQKDNSTITSIEDCDPFAFQHFLRFVYTSASPDPQKMTELCCDMYSLAYDFGVEPLKEKCLPFILAKKIKSQNAVDLYALASKCKILSLLETTWEFIKTHEMELKTPCSPKPVEDVREMLTKMTLLKAQLKADMEKFTKSRKRKLDF